MSTGTEIINSGLAAATKTAKPVSLWASAFKTFVFTHPVGFFAVTGSAIASYGAYSYFSQKIETRKERKDATSNVKEDEMI